MAVIKRNLLILLVFLVLAIFLVEYVSTGNIIPRFNIFDQEPPSLGGAGSAITSVTEITNESK